jgi:hypothetical protein
LNEHFSVLVTQLRVGVGGRHDLLLVRSLEDLQDQVLAVSVLLVTEARLGIIQRQLIA